MRMRGTVVPLIVFGAAGASVRRNTRRSARLDLAGAGQVRLGRPRKPAKARGR